MFLALVAGVPVAAWAGWNPFKKVEPEPVVEPEPEPEPLPDPIPELFPEALPWTVGAVPEGLASLSAQGCAACHPTSHDGWSGSPHASGWRSEAFVDAVADVGSPACLGCHLPLVAQHERLATYDAGRLDQPRFTDNPGWRPTLQVEGVTCAACHVRDGAIVTTSAEASLRPAPHPMVWSDTLGTSEGCAACHQLTWPGADQPFYDTHGEWERSPQGQAGIGCTDCHVGGAADAAVGTHAFRREGQRAVSVLFDVSTAALVRGGDPLAVTITLQNTGAGHAWPTGSPFSSAVLVASLEGPEDDDGNPATGPESLRAPLGRTLGDVPPWPTVEDTRLQAGEERILDWEASLPIDAPAGDWALVIRLQRQVRGADVGPPVVQHRLPLRVD